MPNKKISPELEEQIREIVRDEFKKQPKSFDPQRALEGFTRSAGKKLKRGVSHFS